MSKPNCYDCKFRRELVGNTHSRCAHPSIGESVPVNDLLAAMGVGFQTAESTKAARHLNIAGHSHGIRMGWFIWPWNFDPTWLESCDGFESRTTETVKE